MGYVNIVQSDIVSKYTNVVNQFVSNIPTAVERSPTTKEGMVNIHFFLEERIVANAGLRGVNVFISHGIADKRYRVKKCIDKFDYIIVTGPAWRDKLIKEGISPSKIKIGGYLKIDHLFNMQQSRKHILYAPSHNCYHSKALLSSYPGMLPIINRHHGIKVCPHPANNPTFSYTDTELCTAVAVIADVGSTLYEAWALGRPVVFPNWMLYKNVMRYFRGTFEAMVYSRKIDYHVMKASMFSKTLKAAVDYGITKEAELFIDGLLPKELRGTSGAATLKILEDIYNEHYSF
jgi:hypothetical protein